MLSRGFVEDSSKSVVNTRIRPHLELLLSSTNAEIKGFEGMAEDVLETVDTLKVLLLFWSHFDLNEVNVLLNDAERRMRGHGARRLGILLAATVWHGVQPHPHDRWRLLQRELLHATGDRGSGEGVLDGGV